MIVITGVSTSSISCCACALNSGRNEGSKARRLDRHVGATYFIVPLLGTIEFSLRMRRDAYSFDAYLSVFSDERFRATFGYSMLMAL